MIINIKKFVHFIIPNRYHSVLRDLFNTISWPLYIYRDYRHLIFTSDHYEKIASHSKVIQEYHRLEKAISNPSFVKGRGRAAADSLVAALNYSLSNSFFDKQYDVAICVLSKYLDLQDSSEEWVKYLRNDVAKFTKHSKFFANGGVKKICSPKQRGTDCWNFEDLAINRSSIRIFSHECVNYNDIRRAAEVAQKTPSVCNRQGWRLFVAFDVDLIRLFRSVHKGFSNASDQPLNCLLVVTFSKASFRYPKERNQGYIDASLYAMSLIYALTDIGLATCPLNANLTFHNEDRLRKAFHIDNSYGIVMFIAVGHFLPENIVPVSYRYSADDTLELVSAASYM